MNFNHHCKQQGITIDRPQFHDFTRSHAFKSLDMAQVAYDYNTRQNKIAAFILDNGVPPEWAGMHEIEDAERLLPSDFEYGGVR